MYPPGMLNKRFSDYSDKYIIKRILRHYEVLKEFVYKNANYELADILIDIDNAIDKCDLSPSERNRILLWRKGYTESEVAQLECVARQALHVSVDNACTKVSDFLK